MRWPEPKLACCATEKENSEVIWSLVNRKDFKRAHFEYFVIINFTA